MNMKEKFYKTWWWLQENHEWAIDRLYISVVKVHPKLKRVVDDEKKNTLVNYWLEGGAMTKDKFFGWVGTHDIRLDCGADSFEEAVIKYAKLVRKFYGKKSDMFTSKKLK